MPARTEPYYAGYSYGRGDRVGLDAQANTRTVVQDHVTIAARFEIPSVTLNNGVAMPVLGLGASTTTTKQARWGRWTRAATATTRDAVRSALELGYRAVDTASVYHNEKAVGEALLASGLARSDVFIASKLWDDEQGYDQALRAFERSLDRLQTDYLDLYLLHWPVPKKRADSWRALERLAEEGACRAIGVCNFTIPHLESLLATAHTVPAVNQVEFSPFLYERELLEFCGRNSIQLQAHSPLTRGRRLRDPLLRALAAEYGRTPPQLLLRWALDHGVAVIPKSIQREHLADNLRVFGFALSAADTAALDALDEGLRLTRDPTHVP